MHNLHCKHFVDTILRMAQKRKMLLQCSSCGLFSNSRVTFWPYQKQTHKIWFTCMNNFISFDYTKWTYILTQEHTDIYLFYINLFQASLSHKTCKPVKNQKSKTFFDYTTFFYQIEESQKWSLQTTFLNGYYFANQISPIHSIYTEIED